MNPPLTLTARSPEDLLAAVPCVLGFRPEDSLVLLTFGPPGTQFHARVDLPREPVDIAEVADLLCQAALRNHVTRVALIAYTADSAASSRALAMVVPELEAEGIQVVDVLRVEPDRWFLARPDRPESPPGGVRLAGGVHPFEASTVLEGKVVLGSRAELAATLDADDPEEVAAVTESARAAAGRLAFVQPAAEGRWVRSVVARHVDRRELLTVAQVARLLVALRDVDLRDCAWSTISRGNAATQVDLWRDVVRRSPDELVAPAAALLAFAAWQAGHGALAWCALDRCQEADPDYSLAELLGQVLAGAVPPHVWEPVSAALTSPVGGTDGGGPDGTAA